MKKFDHLITFCFISFLNTFCFSLFQNYIFNMMGECTQISFRAICMLQIFSLFNFFGSFFWSKLADTTKKHNWIMVFNSYFYGILVIAILMIKSITNKTYQLIFLVIIAIFREFTLGSFGPSQDALIMNYLAQNKRKLSLMSHITFVRSIGIILSMLYQILIDFKVPKNNHYTVNLITFFSMVSLTSFFLIFTVPPFKTVENENFSRIGEYQEDLNQNNQSNEKDEVNQEFYRQYDLNHNNEQDIQYSSKKRDQKNILQILMTKSLFLLYISALIAGIFKCIVVNFLPTFLRVRGEEGYTVKVCYTIRSIIEAIAIFLLSSVTHNLSILFMSSIVSAFLSLLLCFISNYHIYSLYFSEILIGYNRSMFSFSTILLFRTYSTSETQSQLQGLRNSAYNGMACVVFGVLAFFFVPSDIVDPSQAKPDQKSLMNAKINDLFLKVYKYLMVLVALSIIPAFVAFLLRKKHL
ncbi:hypothetical protein M153_2750009285 [Pseudoloma neurophilia]|uniref:Major facilitator superfamily associated domain-containing protein n=1 Tax=Pseudoloma neurophilia TaxID=146866 RepID=A0A0R0M490_9MICR|nr:hypothetical protein M153_2750009285 [Pseudoloma neurophilia]